MIARKLRWLRALAGALARAADGLDTSWERSPLLSVGRTVFS